MTFVVGSGCINCVHTACYDLCPVEAFHRGPNFVVINPISCIDCALCPSACPEEAIYADRDLPENQSHFLQLNSDLSEKWPVETKTSSPMDGYENWTGKEKTSDMIQGI